MSFADLSLVNMDMSNSVAGFTMILLLLCLLGRRFAPFFTDITGMTPFFIIVLGGKPWLYNLLARFIGTGNHSVLLTENFFLQKLINFLTPCRDTYTLECKIAWN